MADPATHQPIEPHPHVHDSLCGHATMLHGDHVDYLHDGRAHHLHGDHVDEEPVASSEAHLTHAGHMHVHADGCGHPAVPHGNHVDYVHGAHRHTGHQLHYDEH